MTAQEAVAFLASERRTVLLGGMAMILPWIEPEYKGLRHLAGSIARCFIDGVLAEGDEIGIAEEWSLGQPLFPREMFNLRTGTAVRVRPWKR